MRQHRRFTAADDQQIINRPAGMTVAKLAVQLNRTTGSVTRRYWFLCKTHRLHPLRPCIHFTPREDALIRDPNRSIAELLSFMDDRSAIAIQSRAQRLGVDRNNLYTKTTAADDLIIAEATPETIDNIARHLDRPSRSIIQRHRQLVAAGRPTKCDMLIKPNYFTAAEDEFIVNSSTLPVKEIAKHLNRSLCGVYKRMRKICPGRVLKYNRNPRGAKHD